MKRYKIIFSYDGSGFSGYQSQPGLRTIQTELETALQKINAGNHTPITSSGRTDKGVHALAQVAHFDLSITITTAKLKRALNSNLPEEIHVIKAEEVEDAFHARYDVKKKQYGYRINLGEYDPIRRNYIYQCNHSLSIEKMKQAILYLKGTHDFRAFVSESNTKENCIRTITKVGIRPIEQDIYEIIFEGTGFLKYQVRNMVGLLIKIGEGKKEPEEMLHVLESKDRSTGGKTAPAEGLYLRKVEYKNKGDAK